MFIKVHDEKGVQELYINSNKIDYIYETLDYCGIVIGDGLIRVKEHADDIMKIITYFKVGNDK